MNEGKIYCTLINFLQGKIPPSEFKESIKSYINISNINLYTIIDDLELINDKRFFVDIKILINAIRNFLIGMWTINDLEEWAWNVNGLEINEQDEETAMFIVKMITDLENIEINNLDKMEIEKIYNEILQKLNKE
ncbi:hypothetical protein [Neobacillus cucumis]|uniref:hypothetical protein n=1 Tax=Neobacillus cucumis TaxID=1740721 RepID=UPI002E220C40|nr:hypothetical protein [Neobacillus cucumis]